MKALDAVRFGEPVEAAGRVVTPVIRVRYAVTGVGGSGSVEPLGLIFREDESVHYYPFSPGWGWEEVAARLDE
ncbi:MAG: hypothetical protein GXY82_11180 [Methanospirillum sp.]|nr:hypothetical protein [Methanospirillum sp.]